MKRWRIVIMIAVFALLAAACANEGETTTTAAGGGEATTTTAAEGGGDATTTTAAEGGGGETTGYTDLDKALAGEYAGTEVEILSQWVEAEDENFTASLASFAEATGINVKTEGITDYETILTTRVDGGNAPDLAQIAQPGLMQTFASEGTLIPLSGDWFNLDQLKADYIPSFVDLATYESDVYGVYYKGDLKSIVWYPVEAFKANGYEVPTSWDELVALSDKIVADGNGNPWCISIEHGDASGWVATDWVEDILLRTAPVEIYDQWITHEIPFNHPEVLEAAEYMKQIWYHEDYVYGGNTGINAIFVGDTQTPMFDPIDAPQCWMHKQAAWIPGFWPKDANDEPIYTPGVDSSFFYFPPIEAEFGSPVLGGGDMFVMFNDRPEVRAVIEYLATADAAKAWIEIGGFVSPNQSVPLDWYTQYPNDVLAEILASASTFRFDASDTMPKDVGGGTFWSGMVDWIAANGENTEAVFQAIEDSWPSS